MRWYEKVGLLVCICVIVGALFYGVYQAGYAQGALVADQICYCGRK